MATDLENAERRSLLVTLATEDTIWDWDLSSDTVNFSAKMAKFGHKDWAKNQNFAWWEGKVHPDDRAKTVKVVREAIRNSNRNFAVEYRFCKADGSFAYIYSRGFIMTDENGVAFRAIRAMIDVTELRLIRESLRKTENQLELVCRLNAMGTMGSMIAHELNQPLTAAANYIRASRRLATSSLVSDQLAMQDALEAAEENTLRAGEIIRRLRELVAKGGANGCEAHLGQLVDDACTIARGFEFADGIHIITTIEPAGLHVWVDPIQVQQVIINLVRNAIEALENYPNPEIIVRARKIDAFAEISVQDNGCGISDALRDKLFSNVMTAKAAGLGIGLSISRTIVEAQGGDIWLENSEPGKTDFRFTLPLMREGN